MEGNNENPTKEDLLKLAIIKYVKGGTIRDAVTVLEENGVRAEEADPLAREAYQIFRAKYKGVVMQNQQQRQYQHQQQYSNSPFTMDPIKLVIGIIMLVLGIGLSAAGTGRVFIGLILIGFFTIIGAFIKI